MIYIDTSCLIKLVRIEGDSETVARAVEEEQVVIVSELALLEALVDFRARHMAGDCSLARLRHLELQLHALQNQEPFKLARVGRALWETAVRQHRNASVHCRTLDRLHLAAMEVIGVKRLMSHDHGQCKAAEALSYEVLSPGRR